MSMSLPCMVVHAGSVLYVSLPLDLFTLLHRFRNDQEGYACGGSGSLFRTDNGGKSWKRDRSTDDVAGNLYAIKFAEKGNGFILGNDGILLRYIG